MNADNKNLKDNKFLPTAKEIVILHGEGDFTNPCFVSLSPTPPLRQRLYITVLSFRILDNFKSFSILGDFPLFRLLWSPEVFLPFLYSAILLLLHSGFYSRPMK